MADRVFLHVGSPKTGTTYLQGKLWANRDGLSRVGVHLPLDRRLAHLRAVGDIRGGAFRVSGHPWTWDALVGAAQEKPGTAVVSEELMCAAEPQQINTMISSFGDTPVHVVVTARDLLRQVPAEWQNLVRTRSSTTYAEWLDRLRRDPDASFWTQQDPSRVLRRWGEAVPPERLHLVVVPAAGGPPELLWSYFGEALGFDARPLTQDAPSGNPSLGALETELLRRVNASLGAEDFPRWEPYRRAVYKHLIQPVLVSGATTRIATPSDLVAWITNRAEESVARVVDMGVNVVGRLEDLEPRDPVDGVMPDDASEAEMAALATQVIVEMLRHIESIPIGRPTESPDRDVTIADSTHGHIELPPSRRLGARRGSDDLRSFVRSVLQRLRHRH